MVMIVAQTAGLVIDLENWAVCIVVEEMGWRTEPTLVEP